MNNITLLPMVILALAVILFAKLFIKRDHVMPLALAVLALIMLAYAIRFTLDDFSLMALLGIIGAGSAGSVGPSVSAGSASAKRQAYVGLYAIRLTQHCQWLSAIYRIAHSCYTLIELCAGNKDDVLDYLANGEYNAWRYDDENLVMINVNTGKVIAEYNANDL